MTLINVDGVSVIFEGTARLRWGRGPGWLPALSSARSLLPDPVVHSVWPDVESRAAIRLRIRLNGRTVIAFGSHDMQILLSRRRVSQIPAGAFDMCHPDTAKCLLGVAPLSWLNAGDRERGLDFYARVTGLAQQSLFPGEPPILVEDNLVGAREPLRFIYRPGGMGIGQLRQVIADIYPTGPGEESRATSVMEWNSSLIERKIA